MSVIKIIIAPSQSIVKSMKAIHSIWGVSLANIKNAISNGKPIFEEEIFTNEFAEHSKNIRELLANNSVLHSDIKVFEGGFEISTNVLENILAKNVLDCFFTMKLML